MFSRFRNAPPRTADEVAKYGARFVNGTMMFPLATTDPDRPINVALIADAIGGRCKNFPSAVFTVSGPPIGGLDKVRQVISVFSTGKAIETGVSDVRASGIVMIHELLKLVAQKTGISLRIAEPTIHNYVIAATIPTSVCLQSLAAELGSAANYDPMKFPALILTFDIDRQRGLLPPEVLARYKNMSMTIYVSGKFHVTGCSDPDTLWRVMYTYIPLIERHAMSEESAAAMNTDISALRTGRRKEFTDGPAAKKRRRDSESRPDAGT